jgi:Tfp pilus assembly protein PilX
MKKIFNKNQKRQNALRESKGFAMIFTVLVMSLILSITLGMSNIVFKQRILSGLVRDSQTAFYQADTASECALYYDYKMNLFPKGAPLVTNTNDRFTCGTTNMLFDSAQTSAVSTANDYFVFTPVNPDLARPCYTIVIDKRDSVTNIIDARGYNICGNNVRQVERGIRVSY